MNTHPIAAPLMTVALRGRCPRCGKGRLFNSYLKVAERCDVCGLSFAGHDTGDGPAFFIMLPLCLMVTGLALWLEISVEPPRWVHVVLWPTFIALVAGLALPLVKAIMVALQYRHRDVETYDDSAQQ